MAKIDCAAKYNAYGQQNKLIQVIDARRAQQLISRRLLVGRTNRKGELQGFWLAAGAKESQVKNVMRLKPARISIANKAEVVQIGASTWIHTLNMGMMGRNA